MEKDEKDYNFLLKVIKIENNLGKGNAIQEGLKKTVGEYILLMDADLELIKTTFWKQDLPKSQLLKEISRMITMATVFT